MPFPHQRIMYWNAKCLFKNSNLILKTHNSHWNAELHLLESHYYCPCLPLLLLPEVSEDISEAPMPAGLHGVLQVVSDSLTYEV